MKYQVKLDVYEGPLDLLLRLVERQEIAVASVSVCEIIEQFLAYFTTLDLTDIDEGSRFLVTAAALLAVKAQLLLPQPETEKPEADLAVCQDTDDTFDFQANICEYMQFREAAATLGQRAAEWRLRYKRPPVAPEDIPPRVNRVQVARLVKAFQDLLERNLLPEPYTVRSPALSLPEMMETVLITLGRNPGGVVFRTFFHTDSGREEIICTFLAILELVYRARIKVEQDGCSGEIFLTLAGLENTTRGN